MYADSDAAGGWTALKPGSGQAVEPCVHALLQLGVGLRSNLAAAKQLMEQDLLGSSRFAVVRDDFDRNQVSEHVRL